MLLPFSPAVRPYECVGKNLQKFSRLLVIMLTAFALAGLRTANHS